MKIFRGRNELGYFYIRESGGLLEAARPGTTIEDLMRLENGLFGPFNSEFEAVPCVVPSKIVCVGRNYEKHAAELGNEVPPKPLLFLKAPSSITGNGDPIRLPLQSEQVEHEAELAFVVGRKAKDIRKDEDISRYILGYCCLNDVTARDIQRSDVQFTRAKSFDTFCPVGPSIETDLNCSDISVYARVNGELRQSGRTSDMIFDIPYLLRYISEQMTLMPGDVIATGTPSGVSRLVPGDLCEIEIEGVGVLRNPVVRSTETRKI